MLLKLKFPFMRGRTLTFKTHDEAAPSLVCDGTERLGAAVNCCFISVVAQSGKHLSYMVVLILADRTAQIICGIEKERHLAILAVD